MAERELSYFLANDRLLFATWSHRAEA